MGISSVTSEALQLKLRQLLPSQQGFGTDLSASDTIIPVIDLTQAAEGSDVRQDLQSALAFGSQTAFDASNSTVVIANNTGFFRIFGCAVVRNSGSGANNSCILSMSDGLTTKTIWGLETVNTTGEYISSENVDVLVFLSAGDSISAISNSVNANFLGSSRQIADVNGTLVQPVGFTPQ